LGRSFVKIQAILISAVIVFSSCAFADPMQSRGGVLQPAKINGIVRSMGLMPTGQPVRNGFTYAVLATSRRGMSVRVIVDARFGKVLSVQRVIAVIPPGAYPAGQQVNGPVPGPYAPRRNNYAGYSAPWTDRATAGASTRESGAEIYQRSGELESIGGAHRRLGCQPYRGPQTDCAELPAGAIVGMT
jgi:hypothetical protein